MEPIFRTGDRGIGCVLPLALVQETSSRKLTKGTKGGDAIDRDFNIGKRFEVRLHWRARMLFPVFGLDGGGMEVTLYQTKSSETWLAEFIGMAWH